VDINKPFGAISMMLPRHFKKTKNKTKKSKTKKTQKQHCVTLFPVKAGMKTTHFPSQSESTLSQMLISDGIN
jgi:tripartite-type tricarboxylate transporter receptor subunit TctC